MIVGNSQSAVSPFVARDAGKSQFAEEKFATGNQSGEIIVKNLSSAATKSVKFAATENKKILATESENSAAMMNQNGTIGATVTKKYTTSAEQVQLEMKRTRKSQKKQQKERKRKSKPNLLQLLLKMFNPLLANDLCVFCKSLIKM